MWACILILLALSDYSLNQGLNERVVGGTTANIRSYPWQISLMYLARHVCGGAILSENWAITTARCVTQHDLFDNNNLLLMHIRAGSSFHDREGTIHAIEDIHAHLLFNPVMNHDYDIALIKVKTPFDFESGLSEPVKLPPVGVSPPSGVMAHFTGWGSEKENGILSDQLKVVELPVLSIARCRELYQTDITLRMFCAGYEKGGKGFCSGDFGGPLVINGYLYGLASWSYGCANQNFPGVFSHIGALRSWIKQISNIKYKLHHSFKTEPKRVDLE